MNFKFVRRDMHLIRYLVVAACLLAGDASNDSRTQAQDAAAPSAAGTKGNENPIDLLKLVDVDLHRRQGVWKITEAGLVGSPPGRPALCDLPVELAETYELSFEFTRTDGGNAVAVILPLGTTQCVLELSGWAGAAHGISRVDGRPVKDPRNPASVKPGTLDNGTRYAVRVQVARNDDNLALSATLDDKPLVDWRGKLAQLEPNLFIRSDNNKRPVLVSVDSTVVFHRVTLDSGSAKIVAVSNVDSKPKTNPAGKPASTVPIQPGTVDLKQVAWRPIQGSTRVASFRGEDVLELTGPESVAFLPDVEIRDGVIECEIASATFSGFAFRGKDLTKYECLYFRPFNSGTAKHMNTVQYASHGVPQGGWSELRQRFPGKYESGADIKVNEWFHAKIVIEGESMKAYVNKSQQPVLEVEKMLGKQTSGKLGIWGWGTYFRNFKFTPAAGDGKKEPIPSSEAEEELTAPENKVP